MNLIEHAKTVLKSLSSSDLEAIQNSIANYLPCLRLQWEAGIPTFQAVAFKMASGLAFLKQGMVHSSFYVLAYMLHQGREMGDIFSSLYEKFDGADRVPVEYLEVIYRLNQLEDVQTPAFAQLEICIVVASLVEGGAVFTGLADCARQCYDAGVIRYLRESTFRTTLSQAGITRKFLLNKSRLHGLVEACKVLRSQHAQDRYAHRELSDRPLQNLVDVKGTFPSDHSTTIAIKFKRKDKTYSGTLYFPAIYEAWEEFIEMFSQQDEYERLELYVGGIMVQDIDMVNALAQHCI